MLTCFLSSRAFVSDDLISSFTSFLIVASFLFTFSCLSLLSLKASPSPLSFVKQRSRAYILRLKLPASPSLAAPPVFFSLCLLSMFSPSSILSFMYVEPAQDLLWWLLILLQGIWLFAEECCEESIKSRQPGLSTTQVS